MRALGRALRADLHRCASFLHFVTVVALFTWLRTNCGRHLTSQTSRRVLSAAEMLNYTLTGTLSLVELVLAIAAVAYAWSYCHDRSSGFFLQAVERVGLPAYGAARAIAVAVSAFLAAVAALAAFLLLLAALRLPEPDLHDLRDGIAYLDLVARGKPMLYFTVRIVIIGLACSFAAEFGLMVTAFFPNAYVAILSPILLYYLQEILWKLIHMEIRWYLVRVIFGQTYDNEMESFYWAVGYLTVATIHKVWASLQENEKGAGVMKLLRCCKLNCLLQWRIQPKYFLCVVFLTLHMWNLLHGLNDYATALGYRIHPWIFPF